MFLDGIITAFEGEIATPLKVASMYNNYEAVKSLLEKGADPNKFSNRHLSPIEASIVGFNKQSNRLKVIQLLLEYGAQVDLPESKHKEPVLFLTLPTYSVRIDEETVEIIKILINCGAKTTNSSNTSILSNACILGSEELIVYFIEECGLNINHLNNDGRTPLMDAVYNYNSNLYGIQCLVNRGANIYIKDHDGKTVFDYAKEREDEFGEQVFSLLVQSSAK